MRITSRLFIASLLFAPLASAEAQVGHAPTSTPYREILHGQSLSFIAGTFGGSGGKLGIGPHDSHTYGIRYDIRLSTPLQIGVSISQGNFKRLIVDAFDSVANRVKGPVTQKVTMLDLSVQWNLTGGKTWNHLAPYFGSGFGLAFASATPADTSGYKFGNRLYIAPNVGVRFFVTDRLHLRLEARHTWWKLKYPAAYANEPTKQPAIAPASNAVIQDGRLQQWTGGGQLMAGLGYAVSF
ncbi:MAG: hypothetical protein ABJD11_15705 [Gemmatimonadota bacterium]